MFTGIVEELGTVRDVLDQGDAVRLVVEGPLVTSDVADGDSISVDGVCLTVAEHRDGTFTADVMRETLVRSALRTARAGGRVNLERARPADGRLGGHLVQGHVDGVGEVLERTRSDHWEVVRVSLPAALARYVVEKGSITVDGTSLTVVKVVDATDGGPSWFSVSLIPTTLAATTLGRRAVGDPVNLEVDVVAKYVERLLGARAGDAGPDGGAR